MALRRASEMGLLALTLLIAACGAGGAPTEKGDGLRFEDRRAPEVLDREGVAERDSDEGAPGLWAAVPGLARPERAVAINLASGDEVEVSLFSAPRRAGTISLSHEAADELGIKEGAAPIRLVALRSKPEIDFNQW